MAKKTRYISFETPTRVEIVLGKSYVITDYRDQELPGTFVPFKQEEPGGYYVCKNELGGNVWVKPGEFLRLAE